MPDCHQSTDLHPTNPSPRRQRASITVSQDHGPHTNPPDNTRATSSATTDSGTALGPAQAALRELAESLYKIDERLAESVRRLPASSDQFDALAEVRAAIECVRADLLTDAIATLLAVAASSEIQLQACYEERRKWAAVARA